MNLLTMQLANTLYDANYNDLLDITNTLTLDDLKMLLTSLKKTHKDAFDILGSEFKKIMGESLPDKIQIALKGV